LCSGCRGFASEDFPLVEVDLCAVDAQAIVVEDVLAAVVIDVNGTGASLLKLYDSGAPLPELSG
jgi:hypothetical protein